jgi:hypothetical protein
MKLLRLLTLVFALLLPLSAQSPLGTITGLVSDSTGAAVPAASIEATESSTNIKRSIVSNDAGAFTLANLPPGNYLLTVSAKGFQPQQSPALSLAAFRTLRQDFKLNVASNTTAIDVTMSRSPLIQTESPSISTSLTTKQIQELPTNLRSVFNNSGDSGLLFQMAPLTIPGLNQVGAGAAWITPGAGANSVKSKVDGIATDFGNFGAPDPVSQPSMESIAEFTANTLSNRAEFGGMGMITSVTKSGTNTFHANIFWYARNSAMDARNTFAVAKPFQNIHNYGANLAGPLRKDKTFFFFNIDQTRGSRAYLFTSSVPTLAMRQGDFTGLGAIRNPFTNAPYENNRIPASQLNRQGLNAQTAIYPLPNFGAANLTAGNYRAAFNGPEVHDIYEGRVDHNWTSAHSSFARYQWKKADYDIPGARGALPPTTLGTSKNLRRVPIITLGDIWTPRPNLSNEFRAGVLVLNSASSANVTGQSILDAIGVLGLPARGNAPGVPVVNVAGLSTYSQSLLNPVNDGHWQVSNNLTWVLGRHTVKFGGEVVRWFVNRYLPSVAGLYGNFSFTNRFSGQPYGDFLLGLPTAVTRLDPYAVQKNRWTDASFFIQDDWKLTKRLSLSYGLRYEYNQPSYTQDNNVYSFDRASGAVVVPNDQARSLFSPFFPSSVPITTGTQLGLDRSLRQTDSNNWAPRLGLSYLLNSKTVIRAGVGIYYGHFSGLVPAYLAGGPFSLNTTSNNAISNGQALFTFERPFASAGISGTLNLNGVDPNLRNTYSTQYSFTLERELMQNLAIRASYIGSKGTNLPYQRNINQPFASTAAFAQARRPYPIYNNVVVAENGANSLYSGLQVEVSKRFSQGLLVQSAWTWAKSLSEVDDTGSAELNTQIEDAYDRRRDRANLYANPRHNWQNQILYELPFFKGNRLLGGWQVNSLFNMASGNYLNPQFAGSDPSGTNTVGGRPDVATAIQYPKSVGQWFDRAAFTVPANNSGRFGNAARNSILGPGYVIFNAGLQKATRLSESLGTVTVAASFQNLLNHVNLGQPNLTTNNVNGGIITSTHIFPAAGAARTTQLSLRWSF